MGEEGVVLWLVFMRVWLGTQLLIEGPVAAGDSFTSATGGAGTVG